MSLIITYYPKLPIPTPPIGDVDWEAPVDKTAIKTVQDTEEKTYTKFVYRIDNNSYEEVIELTDIVYTHHVDEEVTYSHHVITTFDLNGKPIKIDDKVKPEIRNIRYDSAGRVVFNEVVGVEYQEFEFNDDGDATYSDINGLVITRRFDQYGNKTHETIGDSFKSWMDYNGEGQIVHYRDSDGVEWWKVYKDGYEVMQTYTMPEEYVNGINGNKSVACESGLC